MYQLRAPKHSCGERLRRDDAACMWLASAGWHGERRYPGNGGKRRTLSLCGYVAEGAGLVLCNAVWEHLVWTFRNCAASALLRRLQVSLVCTPWWPIVTASARNYYARPSEMLGGTALSRFAGSAGKHGPCSANYPEGRRRGIQRQRGLTAGRRG